MPSTITCEEAASLIDAFVDGELSASDRSAVERHVAGCAACGRLLADTRAVSATVKRTGREPLPAGLEARVQAALLREGASRPLAFARWRPLASHAGAAMAGALAVALVIGSPLLTVPAEDTVAHDAVAAHIRGLMADQFHSVESSNMHTVKPWFQGKVEFSPRVPDLAEQGYPLLGGRVDYLADRSVAALQYGRREHRITVFVVPNASAGPERLRTGAEHGYNSVAWRDGEFAYFAVSDLNGAELSAFAQLWREAQARMAALP